MTPVLSDGTKIHIRVDLPQHEYAESLESSGFPQVGLKFQIHSPSEEPDVENKGIAIGTGQHGYAAFTQTKVRLFKFSGT